MNKQEAIKFLNAKLKVWPSSTNCMHSPDGWRWVIRQLPYQRPEILLESAEKVDDKCLEISLKETDLK